MSSKNIDESIIQFVSRFSKLMEEHLGTVQSMMASTVQAVMDSAMEIDRTVTSYRENAEASLARDLENPDKGMTKLVNDVQLIVSDVFESAFHKVAVREEPAHAVQKDLQTNEIYQSLLSKNPGVRKELNEKLSALAVNTMGVLSSEDVMIQRIEHIILAYRGIETLLNYLLLDYKRRGTDEKLQWMIQDMLDFVYQQYTSEDEKNEFLAIYPDWKASA